MTTKFDELVAKLKEIFQIDKPELDFGIYKIVNAKAAMIQKFLANDLKAKVQAALSDKASAGKKALEDKIAKLEEQLSAVHVPFAQSPDWVAAKAELDKLAAADDSESLVYAHLLTFFSRYYDDGDFISKRRYKEGQYAIPYSGEEVKLHWANVDQYYTKSGENFTNYDFTVDGKKVHFKLVQAAVAKDNVKDNDCVRCFVLWDPDSAPKEGEDGYDENLPTKILEVKDGELYIYFQYKKFAKGTKQKDFADAAYATILQKMTDEHLIADFPVFREVPTEADKHRTVLVREFTRYMAKNTSDYFIHKNLRKFLTQELDNYVKTEMMNLDDISNAATFDAIASNLRLIQTFRLIAMELIGFMAQLEDFQKKLWLKKKFVVQCDYCITMDQVPEELRAEVLANKAQLDEWKKYCLDGDPKMVDKNAIDARMVDTKFFDEAFKAKLLRSIPDLDDHCDGLLIHSENFGALNLLQGRYRQQVKCIYIDPPYNAQSSEILYKNTYKDSSWLSLLENRISLSKHLISQNAVCYVAIDEVEQEVLGRLISSVFPERKKVCVAVVHNPRGQQGKNVSYKHEFLYILYPTDDSKYLADVKREEIDSRTLRDSGTESNRSDAATCFYPFYVKDGVIVGKGDVPENSFHPSSCNVIRDDGVIEVWPIDDNGNEKKWRYGWATVDAIRSKLTAETKRGKVQIIFNQDMSVMPSVWTGAKFDASEYGTKVLQSLFTVKYTAENAKNLYPKSIYNVSEAMQIAVINDREAIVLDYFGGSGTTAHAVIDLNRQDREKGNYSKRKYILVEMGDHFDKVLKLRVEKVVFSPNWKDGKPVSTAKGISHCFKYMTLESYEDTLNNLKLEKPGELFGLQNEYMLNYMLEIESRKSLLGLDKFAHPFDYTLDLAVDSSGATKPQKVDMVETFNYLIGLRVQLVDRNLTKGYVLVHGMLPSGEDALVLWRDLGKVDNAELKKILDKQAIHPREKGFVLFVNGDHDLPNTVKENGEEKTIKIRSIEADFNRLMFEEA